jgi:uncharacterized protein with PQ loop repeat
MWVDIVAYVAGVFLMFSFLPQVIQSGRTKKRRAISWGMLLFLLLSGILYEVYAIALDWVPVILMNGIFTVTVFVQMCMTLIYDRKI